MVFIFALVVEELLYRGILLNKLRKHGDLFAVVVSSIIFGIAHGARFFTMIPGLFFGLLYVISDSIIAPIALHALYNLGAIYFEKLVLKTSIRAVLFYLCMCIICLAIMLIDKRFKTTFIDLRNKYKEEHGLNKGKYSAAFKSEIFLVFVLIMGIMVALTFSYLFKN
ncbi:CPBP family intramembrane metalloprotease [Clostridium bowmanii]|uniref:CPBP family intramembrane glutamic endopeptidase n=1 Tax=Clostridium bowmanii TaxID=132925 RepID=UPI001C0D205E|nr:CPBP family intramembrane glutamic endopeptidase [Clostridium bowmanii]MBU3188396.1 CPBP family intramembrane metalloprotease [Clostridium bowmanii]MCA1072784.1 CPBP family intramembrane metalloprotease [Clostridium bowmanii]